MSDGITDMAREEESQEEATEKVEVSGPKEVPFDEQLDRAVGQSVEQFYKDVLKQADNRIKAQETQIQNLTKQQLEFRDEVAVRCYVPLIDKVESYDKAAVSAYQAADAFLRARESGITFLTEEEANELITKK